MGNSASPCRFTPYNATKTAEIGRVHEIISGDRTQMEREFIDQSKAIKKRILQLRDSL